MNFVPRGAENCAYNVYNFCNRKFNTLRKITLHIFLFFVVVVKGL